MQHSKSLCSLVRAALAAAAFLATLAVCNGASTGPARRSFDLPADAAEKSLRRFSEQSGVEVFYASGVVKGITTQAVRGEFTPQAALDAMLARTGLVVVRDDQSGAISIKRVEDPKAQGAAPASGRPENSATAEAVAPYAGAQAGALAGTVINGATRVYLEKAEVAIETLGLTTLTEPGGAFRFDRVPPGEHVLIVRYTGLNSERRIVTVFSDQTATVEIALSSELYTLEAFVVAGEREGRAEAITKQRQAPNVTTVVASDEFTNVASGSIGEFMRNLPGVTVDYSGQGGSDARFIRVRGIDPSLNAVTIDGFRGANAASGNPTRAFEIDQVSLQNIETIEVTKAPTPAMDGESIGGSVNLVSKSGLSLKGRRVSYTFNLNGPATEQFKLSRTFGGGDYTSHKIRFGGNFSASSGKFRHEPTSLNLAS